MRSGGGRADSRIRTDDLIITNDLLYQLSYIGTCTTILGHADAARGGIAPGKSSVGCRREEGSWGSVAVASLLFPYLDHHLAKMRAGRHDSVGIRERYPKGKPCQLRDGVLIASSPIQCRTFPGCRRKSRRPWHTCGQSEKFQFSFRPRQ